MKSIKRFIIVTGHYGCGKTNFSINLAFKYAGEGHKVTIVDMDLVNPYFRTSDYRGILEERGIHVIAPVYAATNLDIPSLPAEMYSIFEKDDTVIVDVGGDDVGATVLGRFYRQISQTDHEMLYVVNACRSMTVTPEESVEVMHEIEGVTGLRCTQLVNNTHLMDDTDLNIIDKGISYTDEVSRLTGLPVCCTTVRRDIYDAHPEHFADMDDIYPVDIHVTTVWNGPNKESKED